MDKLQLHVNGNNKSLNFQIDMMRERRFFLLLGELMLRRKD